MLLNAHPPMFIDLATARRIERAECGLNRAVALAALASGAAPLAFVRELGFGLASYVRPGSPLNKLIGVGLDSTLNASTLGEVEEAMRARQEPTRIELSTLAHPEISEWLAARGYRLCGFENVLVKPIGIEDSNGSPVRVERSPDTSNAAWRSALVEATCVGDETGHPVDAPPAEAIETAIEDFVRTPGFDRQLAYLDSTIAGAASMRIEDGVALLCGSATLAPFRRRGVQAALISARLREARAQRAALAVVTTAPCSQSEANLMKQGFFLAYARAILVRSRDRGPQRCEICRDRNARRRAQSTPAKSLAAPDPHSAAIENSDLPIVE